MIKVRKYRIEQLPGGDWMTHPWPQQPGNEGHGVEIFKREENARLDIAIWQMYEDALEGEEGDLDRCVDVEEMTTIWATMLEIWKERGMEP